MTLALVLAGGGVAGIAWELGVLRGISDVDAGLAERLIAADVVVGTSAGSTVAAQITGGTPLAELYLSQLSETTSEIEVELDLSTFMAQFAEVIADAGDEVDRRRRIGAFALGRETVAEPVRRAAIAARLTADTWPNRDLRIAAVEASTGDLVVFRADSGVGLIDAVAASCAVPGVWPPVTIGEHRYVDGGARSATNADLAKGADIVVVITPSPPDAEVGWAGDLDAELASLAPARVDVIYADQSSVDAFGTNPLSPTTRRASALAGREVGRTRASSLAALFS